MFTSISELYDHSMLEPARADFSSGARWMKSWLEHLRNRALPEQNINWAYYGIIKYTICLVGALLFALLASPLGYLSQFIIFTLVFYALEAQMVFLFPLLLEGGEIEIWKRSLKLSNQAGGTVKVMLTVIPIAATMIFGGFFRAPLRRGNFVRAWCIGCLAIIVWYERLRVEEELCKQN